MCTLCKRRPAPVSATLGTAAAASGTCRPADRQFACGTTLVRVD